MNEPVYFLIDSRLRDSLVSYLAGKPWAEVNDGIVALRSLPPAPVQENVSPEQDAAD